MAKNKKPKFLEKETPELLSMLKDLLNGEDLDIPKATKIIDELISRQPDEDAILSVDEALRKAAEDMTAALQKIKDSYDGEVSMMDDPDEDEEEETPKKSKKSSKKKEDPEEDEDSDEDEDEDDEDSEEEDSEDDYSEWSTKDLKKECRNRGIKVTKGMGKKEMIKALEADDQE